MYNQILEELGLTPNEAKIYMALLELKNGTIWDISTHAGIHRRNTYDAIHRLMHKGLAFQVLPKRNLTYAPIHPEKLKEELEALKQKKIKDTFESVFGDMSTISIRNCLQALETHTKPTPPQTPSPKSEQPQKANETHAKKPNIMHNAKR